MENNDNFILPKYWRLRIDNENRDMVNNWRRHIIKYDYSDCSYPYISEKG